MVNNIDNLILKANLYGLYLRVNFNAKIKNKF
jgi:hypothetical protein